MNVLNATELFTLKWLILHYMNFTSISYSHIYTLYETSYIKQHGNNDATAVICAYKKPGRALHLPLTCLTFREYAEYLEQLNIFITVRVPSFCKNIVTA